ncbi:hypothetical protein [Fulvivirga imtechensis]|nr:hypothetical protein [Fulvivirga imtechensis]
MRFLVKTILIAIGGYIAGLYLPFWSLALVAFIVSLIIRTNGISSFLSGFLAIFVIWATLAFSIDRETQSLLTERVAQVFMGISSMTLIIITGVIGGLVGGLGAASGALLVSMTNKKRQQKYYS